VTVYLIHHLVVAALCPVAGCGLARARWARRAPRTAVACWQLIALAGVVSTLGALLTVGVAPYRRGIGPGLVDLGRDLLAGHALVRVGPSQVTALAVGLGLALWLHVSLVTCVVRVARLRRRHRLILDLVAHDDSQVPGAVVLDHPQPAAYCLPGAPPTVVITRGALTLLDRAQVAAVLAHEKAHALERHDLVMLPFAVLRNALPGLAPVQRMTTAVSLLVEMCADDRAGRGGTSMPLAGALLRFGAAGAVPGPPGTLAAVDGPITARIERLLRPGRAVPWAARLAAVISALVAAATPLSLFTFPW
jgi:hypothetical protein